MFLAQNVIAPMFNLITDLRSKQELKSGTCPSLVVVGFWEGFLCVFFLVYRALFFLKLSFYPLRITAVKQNACFQSK